MIMVDKAIEKISKQQGKARSAVWMVGEQLKDICRHEPQCAELICQDLDNTAMSLSAAERKIKEYADSHKTGSFACVTPIEADGILRKFYGLPEQGKETGTESAAPVVRLEDFF